MHILYTIYWFHTQHRLYKNINATEKKITTEITKKKKKLKKNLLNIYFDPFIIDANLL